MVRAILALARRFLQGAPGTGLPTRLVFRGELASEATDSWMKRIIALADGRSSEEMAQALYLEDLRAGAATVDIGLWRRVYFRQFYLTLQEMSERGYIRLVSRDFQSPENHLMVM